MTIEGEFNPLIMNKPFLRGHLDDASVIRAGQAPIADSSVTDNHALLKQASQHPPLNGTISPCHSHGIILLSLFASVTLAPASLA